MKGTDVDEEHRLVSETKTFVKEGSFELFGFY
jgi:hypothetical protein